MNGALFVFVFPSGLPERAYLILEPAALQFQMHMLGIGDLHFPRVVGVRAYTPPPKKEIS